MYTYMFAYAYDALGNRTVQTRRITSTLVTTYTYDAANRLATQNGQSSFTWDANGNLLQDGSTTYAYDFANRPISTTLGGATTQFAYNGDGIRLRLIEAGTLTTYTQDYAAPLPVVLQAKTGTASTQYVYSLGTRPVAEYETAAWEYLLADALDSVRQIADSSGNVTLLKSYEPYGSVLNSQGSATSVFAYAGEQMDAYIKLVFLRARYMQPGLGVFLSRDPWNGTSVRPGSMNGWNYVEGNPINRTDPNGHRWTNCLSMAILYLDTHLTAQQAVDSCREFYSWNASQALVGSTPWPLCEYEWSRPQTTMQLAKDWLCEKGPAFEIFYPEDKLTRDLINSIVIDDVRLKFYREGGIPFREWELNELEFAYATLDIFLRNFQYDIPIVHFLGSFDVSLTRGNGRVHFLVHNKTDRASGTHFRGRFPRQGYVRSVEELIEQYPYLADRPLQELLEPSYGVVSILKTKTRYETNDSAGEGGGAMHQLFLWSERELDCWEQYLPCFYRQYVLDVGDYGLPIEFHAEFRD